MSQLNTKKQLIALGQERLKITRESKSARNVIKMREQILERSRLLRTPPKRWSLELMTGLVCEWVNKPRPKPLTNATIVERMYLVLRVLIQLGNSTIDTPLNRAELSGTATTWSRDRIKGVIHPPKQKALRLSMMEFNAISRHLAFNTSLNAYNQRLYDARRLVMTFTCSSGSRAKDVYHLIPLDAEFGIINGVQVLKFTQRYSKSNLRGSRLVVITLFASDKKPWLCPVRMWREYMDKYGDSL